MQSKWLCREGGGKEKHAGEGGAEAEGEGEGDCGIGKWVPPPIMVKPRKRDLGAGSGLSSQFSDMTINCC